MLSPGPGARIRALAALLAVCAACGAGGVPDMQEIASNVYRIKASRSNMYLLVGERLVLIDAGMKGDGRAVLAGIAAIGRAPREVSHILITHAHIDHTGSLAFLKKHTGALVVAAEAEVDFIEGRRKTASMKRQGFAGQLFRGMLLLLETVFAPYEAAGVDVACVGGEELAVCGPVRVLATPGHSPGSLSYYLPQRGIMVTGDALSGVAGPGLPPRMGCADYAQALQSVRVIADHAFDVVCFGHGDPVTAGADAAVRALVR
jgi:glyoxylase-like metal-dependent hydrolase (beta-lactamase superfamily II)